MTKPRGELKPGLPLQARRVDKRSGGKGGSDTIHKAMTYGGGGGAKTKTLKAKRALRRTFQEILPHFALQSRVLSGAEE